jgi:hypothetical protein
LGTSANKTGATTIVGTPSNITAGDLIIVVLAYDDNGAVTSDYRWNGVTSQALNLDVTSTNAGNVVARIFSGIATTSSNASGDVITSGPGAGGSKAVAVFKASGIAAVSPFDRSGTSTGSSLDGSTGASGTTAQADELLVGVVGWEGPVEDNDGSWAQCTAGQNDGTTGGGAASNITVHEGYDDTSGGIGSFICALTRTANSRDWAGAIATYKAKSGAPRRVIQVGNQRPQSFGLIKMLFAYNFEKHVFMRAR